MVSIDLGGSECRSAFAEFLSSMSEVADRLGGPSSALTDEVDVAEAYRYITHLISGGFDFAVESDPERPAFVRIIGPRRKFQGGNPDAIYMFAPVRGDRSYRIFGRRTDECYLSFMVQAGEPPYGGNQERVAADVSDLDLKIEPDGRYELALSPHPQRGNWLQLPPDARSILTRHYYVRPTPAAADERLLPDIAIEPLASPPPSPPLTDAEMARRLREVSAFVRQTTLERAQPAGDMRWRSTTPNELGTPTRWINDDVGGWGNVHFFYSCGPFEVEPDEALVMEGAIPPSRFWNVNLWNRFGQDLDFRSHRTSLHHGQASVAPDGSYRIVIAHADPRVPNWLDTCGHRHGTIFWRIFDPSEQPPTGKIARVPLSAVRA